MITCQKCGYTGHANQLGSCSACGYNAVEVAERNQRALEGQAKDQLAIQQQLLTDIQSLTKAIALLTVTINRLNHRI